MKEVNVTLESQFLATQSGWNKIDDKDLPDIWSKDSDKGLPVFFRDGDEIIFGEAVKTVPFKTGTGTIANIGHIAAQCKRYGWFWCPISLFRRAPVDAERDELYCEENDFGQKLLSNMKDIDRAKMVTGKTLVVSKVLTLHKPGFDRKANKPDYDNPVAIKCYCFTEK